MIISDLSYLEVVSEVPSIMGGALKNRTNEATVKPKIKVTIKSGSATVEIGQDVSVIQSNDDL